MPAPVSMTSTSRRPAARRYAIRKVTPPDAVSYQWDENSSEFSSGAVFDTFDWPGAYATLSNPATSKVVGKWSTAPYIRNKQAISCAISHGAFYAFPNVEKLTNDDQHLARFLLDEGGVAILGGSSFGVEGAGHLRISYASSMEEIKAGLDCLAKAIPQYTPAT